MASPVIGQPVQFNSPKGAEEEGGYAIHPALVAAVLDGGVVDLWVFGPHGSYQRPGVPQATEPAPDTWTPLPKVK